MSLKWNGPKVKKKLVASVKEGINKTMADCVSYAKDHHPGWKNQTGTAEGSIRITQFAELDRGDVSGQWGSVGVDYFKYLELNHGSALRMSADTNYSKLKGYIRAAFKG